MRFTSENMSLRKLRFRHLALVTILVLIGGAAHGQNLDQGKSAARLFSDGCSSCHRSPRGLAKGRFRLTLRKDLRLDYPRAETETHYLTMAMDPDLDQCVVRALRDMIALLGEKRNLSREDAYTLCSLASDLRVTQTVNGSKGIHCMIAKSVVHG